MPEALATDGERHPAVTAVNMSGRIRQNAQNFAT